jgi:hypothetical protein
MSLVNSHLKSPLLSLALFRLISRIVSIFSKFCGSPINHAVLISILKISPLIHTHPFTSACFRSHQLARRLRYCVHDKSIKCQYAVENFGSLCATYFDSCASFVCDSQSKEGAEMRKIKLLHNSAEKKELIFGSLFLLSSSRRFKVCVETEVEKCFCE